MSQKVKIFFALVAKSPSLQQTLYNTREISDVAVIAQEYGFNIKIKI